MAQHVVINSVSGQVLELDVEVTNSIVDIKGFVADAWGIHPRCQKLFLGTNQLDDSDLLGDHCATEGAIVSMMVLASLDSVCGDLLNADRDTKVAALQIIGDVGRKGNDDAIMAVVPCLEDGVDCVRQCAVEALIKLARKGDKCTIGAVLTRLEHQASGVRSAAILVLKGLVEKGDSRAISAVAARLHDRDSSVSHAALQLLCGLAEKGDSRAIEEVSACLEHEDDGMRQTANDVLSRIAERGDKRPINMVAGRLEDGIDDSKRFSLDFLVQLASKSDRHKALEVTEYLHTHDYSQRFLALMALKELSKRACSCNANHAGARRPPRHR